MYLGKGSVGIRWSKGTIFELSVNKDGSGFISVELGELRSIDFVDSLLMEMRYENGVVMVDLKKWGKERPEQAKREEGS